MYFLIVIICSPAVSGGPNPHQGLMVLGTAHTAWGSPWTKDLTVQADGTETVGERKPCYLHFTEEKLRNREWLWQSWEFTRDPKSCALTKEHPCLWAACYSEMYWLLEIIIHRDLLNIWSTKYACDFLHAMHSIFYFRAMLISFDWAHRLHGIVPVPWPDEHNS